MNSPSKLFPSEMSGPCDESSAGFEAVHLFCLRKERMGCMTSSLLCLSFLCAKALPGVLILNSKSLTLWGNAVLAGLSEDSLAPVPYLAEGLCWTIYIQNSSSMCFLSAVSLAKATGKGFFVIQWQRSNREPPWGQKVGSAPSLEPRPLLLSIHLIL